MEFEQGAPAPLESIVELLDGPSDEHRVAGLLLLARHDSVFSGAQKLSGLTKRSLLSLGLV